MTTLKDLIDASFNPDVLAVETEVNGACGVIKHMSVQFVRLGTDVIVIHSTLADGRGAASYHTFNWHAEHKGMKGTDRVKILANDQLYDVTLERKKHRTLTLKATE